MRLFNLCCHTVFLILVQDPLMIMFFLVLQVRGQLLSAQPFQQLVWSSFVQSIVPLINYIAIAKLVEVIGLARQASC